MHSQRCDRSLWLLDRSIAVAVLRCSSGKIQRCEMAQQGRFTYFVALPQLINDKQISELQT